MSLKHRFARFGLFFLGSQFGGLLLLGVLQCYTDILRESVDFVAYNSFGIRANVSKDGSIHLPLVV